uniref:Remorin C-terminal domain-containing protein n=1 Tax=Aegilops tauschii subsp. strangulata TaxID=200361 RepID=A0A453HD48_AEGTS
MSYLQQMVQELASKVQADQMRARAKNNMTKRLSPLGHKVEGKQARVEARQNWRALRLARQVKRIRKTDRMPSRFRCYNWFLC